MRTWSPRENILIFLWDRQSLLFTHLMISFISNTLKFNSLALFSLFKGRIQWDQKIRGKISSHKCVFIFSLFSLPISSLSNNVLVFFNCSHFVYGKKKGYNLQIELSLVVSLSCIWSLIHISVFRIASEITMTCFPRKNHKSTT